MNNIYLRGNNEISTEDRPIMIVEDTGVISFYDSPSKIGVKSSEHQIGWAYATAEEYHDCDFLVYPNGIAHPVGKPNFRKFAEEGWKLSKNIRDTADILVFEKKVYKDLRKEHTQNKINYLENEKALIDQELEELRKEL